MAKREKIFSFKRSRGAGSNRSRIASLIDQCIIKCLETEIGRPDLSEEIAQIKATSGPLAAVIENKFDLYDQPRKEALLRLILYLEDKALIPFLYSVLNERAASISLKKSASNILVAIGEERDIERFTELDKADRLQMRLEGAVASAPEEGATIPDDQASKLAALNSNLRRAVLLYILENHGATALRLLFNLFGRDEETDLIIVEAISSVRDEKAARQLRLFLKKSSSKKVTKAIKKTLYKFEQHGTIIEDEESPDTSRRVWQPPKKTEPEGYLSSVDPAGDMMVWVIAPMKPRGMVLFEGLVNDRAGLKLFSSFQMARKWVREFKKEIIEETDLPIVQTDPLYCAAILDEAYEGTEVKQSEAAIEYSQARGLLSPPSSKARPVSPIYGVLEEGEIEEVREMVHLSPRLLEQGAIPYWLPPEELVMPHFEAYRDALSSKIVLNEYQKKERLDTVCRNAAKIFYDGRERSLMKRRLEIMAWVFWKEDRREDARLALAAALSLGEEGPNLGTNPFLVSMIQLGFDLVLHEEEEQKKEEPPWVIQP